jgi:hypothetical protein
MTLASIILLLQSALTLLVGSIGTPMQEVAMQMAENAVMIASQGISETYNENNNLTDIQVVDNAIIPAQSSEQQVVEVKEFVGKLYEVEKNIDLLAWEYTSIPDSEKMNVWCVTNEYPEGVKIGDNPIRVTKEGLTKYPFTEYNFYKNLYNKMSQDNSDKAVILTSNNPNSMRVCRIITENNIESEWIGIK